MFLAGPKKVIPIPIPIHTYVMYMSKTWQILLTTLCPSACSWSGLESVPASGTAVRHVTGFPASNSCRNHSLSPKRRPTRRKSKNEISDSFMSFTIFALCPFLLLNSVGFLLISFSACYSCSSCCFLGIVSLLVCLVISWFFSLFCLVTRQVHALFVPVARRS